ncbi:hypothetical protein G6F57_023484 [Rhizopus arrhizus]|nr:hypothetical protein G6F57_023484 [Rhizopus arrhizus]
MNAQQFLQRLPVGLADPQLEAAVEAVMGDHPQAKSQAHPRHQRGRQAGAGGAHGGQAQLAVDEQPVEEGLEADGRQVDGHDQLGA